MIYREKKSKLKDHPFSIAEGRTKFHRFLRSVVVGVAASFDMALLMLFINTVPIYFGIDVNQPAPEMESKWLNIGFISVVCVVFVFFIYYSLRACDWLCKQLRI